MLGAEHCSGPSDAIAGQDKVAPLSPRGMDNDVNPPPLLPSLPLPNQTRAGIIYMLHNRSGAWGSTRKRPCRVEPGARKNSTNICIYATQPVGCGGFH